jgi:ABC-type antimicrobial peptide transport system permease subunit
MIIKALLLVVAGILLGVPLAVGASRLVGGQISGLLFGVQATDPMIIARATWLLIAVSTLAAYLPARRASRVDPMVALRSE